MRPRFGKPPAGSRDRGGSRDGGGPSLFSLEPSTANPASFQAPEAERFGQAPADDLVWGRHPAQAALESGRPIHRIWCTAEMRFSPRFLQLLREAKASGVLVEEVTWARLGQLTGGAVHQGIVLQTAAAETLDLGTLIEGCRNLSEPALLMAVDGLTDPHNLGAIVRSAESLGAHGLVLPQRRNAGLTGTVAKVAAGALEHLPVARVVNLNRSLETLKQEGYRVIGLAEEGTVGIHEVALEGPLVVVTGSEGSGLSLLTRRHCDALVRIPLRGATPSLNASVATALLLFEIARRGWMKDVSGTAPAPRIQRPVMPAPPPVDRSAPALDLPNLEESTAFIPHTNPESSAEPTAVPTIEKPAVADFDPLQSSAEQVGALLGVDEPLVDASMPAPSEKATDLQTASDQPPHPVPEWMPEPSSALLAALPETDDQPSAPLASPPTSYFDADIAL